MDLGRPHKIKIAWRWLVRDRCIDGLVNYRRLWKGLRGLMVYLCIWILVIVGEGYFTLCLFCQGGLWEILLLIEGEIGRINPNKSTCLFSNSTYEAMTVLPLCTFLLIVLMLTTRLKPNFIANLPILKIIMRWNRRPIPINITLILILYSNERFHRFFHFTSRTISIFKYFISTTRSLSTPMLITLYTRNTFQAFK